MKKQWLFILVLLALGTTAFSQQKYGHINSEEILDAMPEYKQLTTTVENKKRAYALQFQKMYEDLERRNKEMNEYGQSMMKAVQEERLREIDSIQQALQGFEGNAAGEIEKLQAKLLKPLNDKYLKIVQTVAKENGYTYIFDLSRGNVAYHPETEGDVTDLVKKRMGIN